MEIIVRQLSEQPPFTTKDGSTIRSLLDLSNAPVQNQSLAEAHLPQGAATERHYHRLSEEFYYIVEGKGEMTLGEQTRTVGPGDAILIPPGTWHTLRAIDGEVRLLCCCAPPYSHDDTYFE